LDEAHKVLGVNPHDVEGEGEEDETTVHTSKVKVYRMVQKEGKSEWAEVGVGMLRLKKHKEKEARRVLARNSANGKIMLNFKIYPGLNATRTKQALTFIGHHEGKMTTYRLRLKDEPAAIALKDALDAEVAATSRAAG